VKNGRRFILAAFVALLPALLASSAAKAAESECQPFPKLSVWSGYTHARIQGFVETKYKGDWAPFLTRLEKRQTALSRMQADGKPLVLKHKGKKINLSGKKLAAYIRAAEMRLDVARCLAEESDVASLDNFATAAGQEKPNLSTARATIQSGTLDLRAEGHCEEGAAVFKITNEGASWPKSGSVGLYNIGDGQPRRVVNRRLRMKTGQNASFKVKAEKNETGEVGLFINPSWSKRPFALDAKVSCS